MADPFFFIGGLIYFWCCTLISVTAGTFAMQQSCDSSKKHEKTMPDLSPFLNILEPICVCWCWNNLCFLRKFGCFASDRSLGAKSLPSEAFEISCQSLETTAKRGCKTPKTWSEMDQRKAKTTTPPETPDMNPIQFP